MSVVVTYSSNNSGGSWWLTDEDWQKLEDAGWCVHWRQSESLFTRDAPRLGDLDPHPKKGIRWLGALATEACKEFATPAEAIAEFERITGQPASEEGCNCCGPPHTFNYRDEDGKYHYTSVEVRQTETVWS